MKRLVAFAALTVLCGAASIALGINHPFASVAKGRYLAYAGDCAACHTADGGKPYAGGRPVPTPFGTIYSTNITPDQETGIGSWSGDDFWKAMHEGIAKNGKNLYPAFPYPWYTRLSREDVNDLKAFLDALPAVHQDNKPPELPWPFSARTLMESWNGHFFKEGTFQPDPKKSETWNRGAYLVEGYGHCGACHTPKNIAGAPKTKDAFQGGYGENWYATSLTHDVRDGLGNWSIQDIVEYLKTGSNAKAAATGPMAEVIQNSTQHLTDSDLRSMAVYLKDIPGKGDNQQTARSDDGTVSRGKAIYVDQCSGCHMENGEGQPGIFPPLKGNAVVQARDPETMVHMILGGARVVSTTQKPTGFAMPAFDWKLSDQDVADLASYLRGAWGNRADPVSASEIKKTRERIKQAGQ